VAVGQIVRVSAEDRAQRQPQRELDAKILEALIDLDVKIRLPIAPLVDVIVEPPPLTVK
jgi:hypothetical protein